MQLVDSPQDLIFYLGQVPEPRVSGRCKHLLIDILAMGVLAIISGASTCAEIEEFGHQRESWLRKYLKLTNGIPSHDTFARVFSIIDSEQFEKAFIFWVKAIRKKKSLKRLSVDGKSVRGTLRHFVPGTHPLHLVSVYSHEEGLVLAQSQAKSTGSGETAAVLKCLRHLNLKGTLVSMDAGLSSRTIVSAIDAQGGAALLPIKKNQKNMRNELRKIFARKRDETKDYEKREDSRGRMEIRKCKTLPGDLLSDDSRKRWCNPRTLICVERERHTPDKRYTVTLRDKGGKNYYQRNANHRQMRIKTQKVYYLSSRRLRAHEALQATRDHWKIENQLHWQLDVTLLEDKWRTRVQQAARNFSVARKIAFNLMQKMKDKGSKRVKLKRAAWNLNYLEKLVFG